MKRIKVTIKRSKWCAGYLRNDEGKMCALGFVADRLKVPSDIVYKFKTLHSLANTHSKFKKRLGMFGLLKCIEQGPEAGYTSSSSIANKIMEVNDTPMVMPVKEALLKELFDKLNMDLEFAE